MPAARRILIVDDDPALLKLLRLRLSHEGYDVLEADSAERALALLAAHKPDLLITDMQMAGMDGLALYETLRRQGLHLPVLILTAHGTIADAVRAIQRGVFGYLTKPFEARDLLREVGRALGGGAEHRAHGSDGDDAWRAAIVTRSPALLGLLDEAKLVAASDAAVLIQGESGTGKELLARAIHLASARAAQPFVAINCGAIPENLLESELFGHVKGAFTGAVRDHPGLLRSAGRGTVLLDEVGDLPLAMQVKLLRVLQERELRPVGSSSSVRIDIRVLSATHRDLDAEVRAGRFREDLYYRLNVVALRLPPLAERREDIAPLAQHFLREIAQRYGKPVQGMAPAALEALATAPWPGNVRQLHNVIEKCVVLCTGSLVPEALVRRALANQPGGAPAAEWTSLDEARRHFERDYLAQLLRLTAGNVARAAQLAGRNRTDMYALLARHHLDAAEFKPRRAPAGRLDTPPSAGDAADDA
jgi:two-component system response regulator GlrR